MKKKLSGSAADSTLQRFRRLTKWPLRVLLFFALLSLVAPLIATDEPWYVEYKGISLFPAFSSVKSVTLTDPQSGKKERIQFDIADWKKMDATLIIFAPVPYSPGKSDLVNSDYISPFEKQYMVTHEGKVVEMPFRFRHFLGTGKSGDDILSGMIHGTRISFQVGLLSMILASIIGITLGALAGYFGDFTLKIKRGVLFVLIAGILPAWFYAFYIRRFILTDAFHESALKGLFQVFFSILIFLLLETAIAFLARISIHKGFLGVKINLPVDSIISRIIEVFISLPRLLLILTLASITRPSFFNIVLIIAVTYWTEIARLTRAEMLRLRELDYITAARSLGFSTLRIIFRHALPNSLGAVMVAVAFGAASAILTESGLSFLGIGLPQDVVTWGSLIANGKEHIHAWWLTVFPGIAVFIMVLVYNLLGEGLRTALLPPE